MAEAEDRTVSRLKTVRAEVWHSAIEAEGGRIVNTVADSVLAEFSSAVAAVAAAVDVQDRMARFNDELDEEQRLMFRIGLHLGEVIVDETETIFGDAVNVANRIQLMAAPGGIAVSGEIRDTTRQQIGYTFVDGGRHRAKNVGRSLRVFHVHTRERAPTSAARVTSRIRSARIAFGKPALWGSAAAAVVLLATGGYLASAVNPAATVSTAALTLSAEQLEQALAERRLADALATEKRQLAGEARQRAERESEAKRQADAELARARRAREQAEQELAELKADIEARRQTSTEQRDQAAATAERAAEEAAQRKAEADAASLRQAEEQAARKAAADAAAKLRADLALAEAEAQRKQAEATAHAKAMEEAGAAERSLRLQPADRRHLQIALTALGFDTRGDDGVFGPRSREMIGRWQNARSHPATGFLTNVQQQALLTEAAAVPSRHDDQKKAEGDVATRTIAVAPLPVLDAAPTRAADGVWRGSYECGRKGNFKPFTLNMEVRLKDGSGVWQAVNSSHANDFTLTVKVVVDGSTVSAMRSVIGAVGLAGGASGSNAPMSGRFEGDSITAHNNACTMVLTRDVAPASTASAPVVLERAATEPSLPPLRSPDGSWQGTYTCERGPQMGALYNAPFAIGLNLQVRNGSATWRTVNPGPLNGYSFDVAISVVRNTASVVRTMLAQLAGLGSQATLTGSYDGSLINVTGQERSSGRNCTLALTRS